MQDYQANRMTISDYNTKPVRGDCAIILKLHGSLEIAWGQLYSDHLGLVKVSHAD